MRVLAIDTAGPVVGVALAVDDEVTLRTERVTRGAEGLLLPWAQELCAEAGTSIGALDGVAVTVGPGTFTGLRVGLATAAGLAAARGVPLWTTGSLVSRIARVGSTQPVLGLLDARKARVYGQWGLDGAPADVPPEEALAWASAPFTATGEGAIVYAALVEAAGGVVAPEPDHPAVDTLARLAVVGLRQGQGQRAVDVRPVYVRPPDAKPSHKGRI
ncbi:MAG: tRNA (adenosine(37)-N6)-threonylcarbamoyltransferase complex dimerization subunit type 1 TsaB [Alphaproteobacteria bacterium]|nr:tRNA (adenosine(37)-N6)-threonylcarbamoyltransferase complex dimerization subunit type 1 TsaB [Alphaproteobacteria bacterium]